MKEKEREEMEGVEMQNARAEDFGDLVLVCSDGTPVVVTQRIFHVFRSHNIPFLVTVSSLLPCLWGWECRDTREVKVER